MMKTSKYLIFGSFINKNCYLCIQKKIYGSTYFILLGRKCL